MIKQDYILKICQDGCKYYYYKDKPHRLNGPAISLTTNAVGNKLYDIQQYYYVNGERHRLDGPAVIWGDIIHYYVNKIHIFMHDFYDNYYQKND